MDRDFFQRRLIAFGYWVSTFCEGATRILIPLYFASEGLAISKIAVMFVFYELCGLITNITSGFFINRYGYRFAYLLSLLLHTISSIGYLWISDEHLFWVFVFINILRSCRGVAKELIKTTSSAYYRHLAEHHLHTHYLLGGKDTVKGLGLLAGGVLLTYLSFKISFLLLGIVTGICFFISFMTIRDYKENIRVSYKGFFHVRKNMVYLSFVRAFLYAGRDLWLVIAIPVYLASIGLSNVWIGAILATGLVFFGIVQPLTGVFVKMRIRVFGHIIKSKWYYENIIGISSFLLLLVPLFMIIFKTNFIMVFFLVIIYNIIAGFATAPHNYLHIRMARRSRAAVDIAFYKTVSQLGKVFAVFCSGILYDLYGIQLCLYASMACLFVSGIIGVILSNRVQRFKLQKAQHQRRALLKKLHH